MKTTTTTTAQHTPGPWKAYHYVTDENGRHTSTVAADDGNFRICELTQRFPVPVADTVKANARLIVASPDLLAALQKISANAAESPEWIRRVAQEAIQRATA